MKGRGLFLHIDFVILSYIKRILCKKYERICTMAGRPTKLTKQLIKQVQEYADGAYENLGHVIPSIAGLSEYVSVARETLQVWKKEKGTPLKIEFSNILAQVSLF